MRRFVICAKWFASLSRHIESTNGHRENQAVTVPESVYFSGIIVRRRQCDIFFDHNSIPNDYGPRGQHGERQISAGDRTAAAAIDMAISMMATG